MPRFLFVVSLLTCSVLFDLPRCVLFTVFNFFPVVLYFSFFLPENKISGFDLSSYFVQ